MLGWGYVRSGGMGGSRYGGLYRVGVDQGVVGQGVS